MIVKYLNDGVWSYVDNVWQVENKNIVCDELIKEYDNCEAYQDVTHAGEKNSAAYMNGKELPADITASNKVFTMAVEGLHDEGFNRRAENLLNGQKVLESYPASVILLYLEDCKNYDAIVLITNQTVYLMNDKGQTIERLV